MKTIMIRSGDGDKGAGQYKDDDIINDEGAPSGVRISNDMIESYENGMRATMMMKSPVMMRDNKQMNDDAGYDNGDRGRDDVLPSVNDELDHENRSIEKSTLTPSSSDNSVRNNKK